MSIKAALCVLPYLLAGCASAFALDFPSTVAPSFNCAQATYPDERTIYSSTELSQLDNIVAAVYSYVRQRYGDQFSRSINAPLFQARQACAADAACIKLRQIAQIKTFQSLGAPITIPQAERGGPTF
jgi:uncharacterized protein